jgi:geranylgeranyl pyrophosphate synthase
LKYNAEAKKVLDALGNSDAKQILIELADYSIKREK